MLHDARTDTIETMTRFFSRNITNRGRLVRGIMAVILLVGAFFGLRFSIRLALALTAAGVFTLFEALRGWCVLRACGIKTRL